MFILSLVFRYVSEAFLKRGIRMDLGHHVTADPKCNSDIQDSVEDAENPAEFDLSSLTWPPLSSVTIINQRPPQLGQGATSPPHSSVTH